PRIAQHLRLELPVGIGSGMTAYGPGSDAGIRSQFELAVQEVMHAVLVHDQHDQVHGLAADLEAEAATLDGEKCRRTPALRSAAACHPLAITRTHDETTF